MKAFRVTIFFRGRSSNSVRASSILPNFAYMSNRQLSTVLCGPQDVSVHLHTGAPQICGHLASNSTPSFVCKVVWAVHVEHGPDDGSAHMSRCLLPLLAPTNFP
eukprot:TRINITY_DN24775_c0_g1_i1.p1 TRINITY_DN24775_c0_g1~~TRINITY_DN24775_c0_g1_i1.p1  ORF type:complete len:104 (-),score=3.80 TRINITY_DN24775_c0_g1_i1:146-457(-)